MIEQYSIKDFLFRWVGEPTEGLDDFLPLEYTENVFAKMEAKQETASREPLAAWSGNQHSRLTQPIF